MSDPRLSGPTIRIRDIHDGGDPNARVGRGPDSDPDSGRDSDALEIVARMEVADVSESTLDFLHIAVERLCCAYPHVTADQLHRDGQVWRHHVISLLDRPLTASQGRRVLNLAGRIALLMGCVEYDLGQRRQAETTRRAALSLGLESGSARIQGWAYEMRAWFALTQGDYPGVIAATAAGEAVAANRSVAVQLLAQRAKAWARIGDREQVAAALDKGRSMLERLPVPANLDHHFTVDPAKFDFYAMDCYRLLGDNARAEMYANEIIKSSTSLDGIERNPMRLAEARITLGVLAAREGELDQAVQYGEQALTGDRRSIPSLIMCSQELTGLLLDQYPRKEQTTTYLERLNALAMSAVN